MDPPRSRRSRIPRTVGFTNGRIVISPDTHRPNPADLTASQYLDGRSHQLPVFAEAGELAGIRKQQQGTRCDQVDRRPLARDQEHD